MCATTAPTCSSRSARWAEGASAGFSTAPPLHAIAILPCVQYYLQLPIVVTPASAPSLRTSIPINRYGLSDQLMVIGGKVASTCLVSPVGPSAGSQFAAISAGAHRWSRPHVHQTINGSAGLDRHGRSECEFQLSFLSIIARYCANARCGAHSLNVSAGWRRSLSTTAHDRRFNCRPTWREPPTSASSGTTAIAVLPPPATPASIRRAANGLHSWIPTTTGSPARSSRGSRSPKATGVPSPTE